MVKMSKSVEKVLSGVIQKKSYYDYAVYYTERYVPDNLAKAWCAAEKALYDDDFPAVVKHLSAIWKELK